MLNRIIPLLNKFIPVSLAVKGLGKVDKRFVNYFEGAAIAGFGADQALDYLREKFESPADESERNRLGNKVARGTARPDEMASSKEFERANTIKKGAQTAATLGAAALGAPALAGLIGGQGGEEELQQPTPEEKGFQYPQHTAGGKQSNLPNPLASQAQTPPTGQQQQPQVSTSPLDTLAQFSPALAQFMESSLSQGMPLSKAIWLAKYHPDLTQDVLQIEKGTKQKFQDFMGHLFKGYEQQQKQSQNQSNPQTGGKGQQALMAILQKIQQSRGK